MLECNTYYGELSRMTQFKDKSLKNVNFSAGLLTYPVLMAADILIYDADFVPVGKDQKQHLELARDIAIRFNKKYGETFKVPEPIISFTGNEFLIRDLQNPDAKMSKSAENKKGVILLLDDLEVTRKKIMSATTDSEMLVKFDPENKPGISNLINIYSNLTDKSFSDIEKEFEGKNYGEFKRVVADKVCEVIGNIQNKYNEILNGDLIDRVLDDGRDFTREIACKKYEELKNKIGLVR
jgi:tryptophanyl-tRNA synthetase